MVSSCHGDSVAPGVTWVGVRSEIARRTVPKTSPGGCRARRRSLAGRIEGCAWAGKGILSARLRCGSSQAGMPAWRSTTIFAGGQARKRHAPAGLSPVATRKFLGRPAWCADCSRISSTQAVGGTGGQAAHAAACNSTGVSALSRSHLFEGLSAAVAERA